MTNVISPATGYVHNQDDYRINQLSSIYPFSAFDKVLRKSELRDTFAHQEVKQQVRFEKRVPPLASSSYLNPVVLQSLLSSCTPRSYVTRSDLFEKTTKTEFIVNGFPLMKDSKLNVSRQPEVHLHPIKELARAIYVGVKGQSVDDSQDSSSLSALTVDQQLLLDQYAITYPNDEVIPHFRNGVFEVMINTRDVSEEEDEVSENSVGFKTDIWSVRPSTFAQECGLSVLPSEGIVYGRRRGKARNKGKFKNRRMQKDSNSSKYTPHVTKTVTMRSPVMSPELRMPMRTVDDRVLTAGVSVAELWNPNALFQPLASGPTGLVPGYLAWSRLYGFYRVLSYEYVVNFVNTEAFPVAVYVLNTNNTPGTVPPLSLAANPFSQRKVLSAKGGMDRCIFRKRVTMCDLLGSEAPNTSDSYRALNNASPADLVWLAFCAQSMVGTPLSTGVLYQVTLTMYTHWHDLLLQ